MKKNLITLNSFAVEGFLFREPENSYETIKKGVGLFFYFVLIFVLPWWDVNSGKFFLTGQ